MTTYIALSEHPATLLFMESCISSTSELKMLRLCGVFVLCSSLVQSGFVGVRRDHVVEDDPGKGDGDSYETTALETKARFGDEKDLGRGSFVLYILLMYYLMYISFSNIIILKTF